MAEQDPGRTQADEPELLPTRTRRTQRHRLARLDDGALVSLARRGSDDAWAELVRRLTRVVAALARRYGLSQADTSDALQETLIKLHRNLSVIRQPERVVGWTATTARRECLRIITQRRDEPVDPAVADAEPDRSMAPAIARILATERRGAVEAAMRQVPDRSRRLLELLIWEERSYRDVSSELDMPIGSIGPTRERSLRALARQPEIVNLADDVPCSNCDDDSAVA
jgi:RNA polymerase sigma factor (sigma-70 family)